MPENSALTGALVALEADTTQDAVTDHTECCHHILLLLEIM